MPFNNYINSRTATRTNIEFETVYGETEFLSALTHDREVTSEWE